MATVANSRMCLEVGNCELHCHSAGCTGRLTRVLLLDSHSRLSTTCELLRSVVKLATGILPHEPLAASVPAPPAPPLPPPLLLSQLLSLGRGGRPPPHGSHHHHMLPRHEPLGLHSDPAGSDGQLTAIQLLRNSIPQRALALLRVSTGTLHDTILVNSP